MVPSVAPSQAPVVAAMPAGATVEDGTVAATPLGDRRKRPPRHGSKTWPSAGIPLWTAGGLRQERQHVTTLPRGTCWRRVLTWRVAFRYPCRLGVTPLAERSAEAVPAATSASTAVTAEVEEGM